MRFHRLTAAVVIAAGVLVPTAAHAAGQTGRAIVWSDDPDASMCLAPGTRNWNSLGDLARNEICSDDVGLYSVYLPGQNASAGTVHVTAYGTDAAYCKVESWAPVGDSQRVKVRCRDTAGAAVNSRFTLSYVNQAPLSGGYPFAYVFGSQPTAAAYTPPANYQYNSSGGAANTITRQSAGVYTVDVPGLGGLGGHVQVTGYGPGGEWCNPFNWSTSGTSVRVQVRCYGGTGGPADSKFTMTYVRNGNIIDGAVCCRPSGGHGTSYLFAHLALAADYEPVDTYRFLDGTSRITRLGTGRYLVNYGWGTVKPGVVHVGATGSGLRCKVESFASDDSAVVACTTPTGLPVDTTYLLNHTGEKTIG
ncbi:hypothetical protein Val02_04450 [Virgisporangium aliadipatigenens]|uniref:Uncharacterized protein n=1 Tax=Virgisporangium aliadipatigenens TaxID=741659 RepID=A0A8J3YEA7_9ACTN|nr:hypothetical protein [Virgisporangium aliadipatigenens]GIJ43559.1 hypothetical protein Val02_04450 [Virgisporangium aliadipatigenens]